MRKKKRENKMLNECKKNKLSSNISVQTSKSMLASL